MRALRPVALAFGCAAVLAASGACGTSVRRMSDDRLAYGTELAESWKEQFLLNIVRLRYSDPPALVDVTSIIQQYSVRAEGLASGEADPGAWASATAALELGASYEDRPTVTYTPIRGDQFTRTMLTPLPPSLLMFLVQAGWPADVLFRMYTKGVNGRRNRAGTGASARPADPAFLRALELLAAQQADGALLARVSREQTRDVVTLALPRVNPERGRALADLLGIDPEATELKVVYGAASRAPDEIAVLTRSMLEVMREFASFVEVPEEDVASGRALPALAETEGGLHRIRVRRSETRPDDAFVCVRYRGAWWWIDDRDSASKLAFTVSLLVVSLQETSGTTAAPVVTISAN